MGAVRLPCILLHCPASVGWLVGVSSTTKIHFELSSYYHPCKNRPHDRYGTREHIPYNAAIKRRHTTPRLRPSGRSRETQARTQPNPPGIALLNLHHPTKVLYNPPRLHRRGILNPMQLHLLPGPGAHIRRAQRLHNPGQPDDNILPPGRRSRPGLHGGYGGSEWQETDLHAHVWVVHRG